MSESLGKFVIDLEARISSLESDLGRAERLAQKSARAMQKSMEDSFKRMQGAARDGVAGVGDALQRLTGLNPAQLGIGAVVAGLGEVTRRAIDTGDALNKMAQKTGIGVAALSGIAYQADLSDVALEALGGSMEKLAKNTAAAAGGSREQAAAFEAIGVSVKNADGSIRPLDALLGDVADRFMGYKDGVEKTALAQALFGKSGAAMIPMLNGGSKGLREASAEAAALGYNFDGIAQSSEEFNDNLTRMGKAAVGLGADIARELLPTLIDAERYVLNFVKSARESGSLQAFAAAIAFVVENLDTLAVIIGTRMAFSAAVAGFAAISTAAGASAAAVGILNGAMALLGGPVGILALLTGAVYLYTTRETENEKAVRAATEAVDALRTARDGERGQLGQSAVAIARDTQERLRNAEAVLAQLDAKNLALQESNAGLNASMGGENNFSDNPLGMAMAKQRKDVEALRASLVDLNREISINDALEDMAGETILRVAPNVSNLGARNKELADATKKAAEAQQQFREETAKLAAQLGGPVEKAQNAYKIGIEQAARALQKGEATTADFEERQRTLAAQLVQTTGELARQANLVGQYNTELADRTSMLGLDDRARAIAEAVNTWTESYSKLSEEQKKIAGPLEDLIARVREGEGAFYDQSKAIDAAREQAEKYASIVRGAFDSMIDATAEWAVNGFKNAKQFWAGMVDQVKSAVAKMLAEWAKTKIIGYFTGGGTGGGGGGDWMSAIAGLFTGGGGGGSTAGFNVTDMYAASTGTDWGSTISSVLGGGTAVYGATAGATSVAGTGVFSNVVGGSASTAAAGGTAATGGAMAGTMSWLAAAAPYIALIMWAVGQGDKWFKQGWDPNDPINSELYNKDFMEAGVSGDLKGIGGNTLIDWTVLQTDKWLQDWFGMSENSAAKWSGSSGIMRAWGYKKPEIDWSELFLDFGKDGVEGSNLAHIKAKGGWFRSDKTWDETQDLADETQAQLELFWAQVAEGNTAFAEKFGLKAIEDLKASYTASFTGGGEMLGSTGKIGDHTFSGDTAEQFMLRVPAEAFIAMLTQVDAGISEAVDAYRANAEEFAEAAQVVIGINGAMADGLTFLGTSSNDTLSEVFAFIEGMERAGETVAEAFNRLLQANQAYFDFVGQFAPGATYVNDFQAALSQVNAQMLANIDRANALARAAGAEGAATQDLVNIHAYAAKQFAQLLRQLQDQAQALAFSMGLSNIGNLGQIDAEIARLEGLANQGASAVGNFGDAMQAAAQSASDAMNLLLGDLSPLNDQRKLAIALQGLYAGTVSQEDVLAIGRRLYATGQQYVDLFNTVMQHGGQMSPAGGGSGGNGGVGTPGGMTAADRERLESLYAQRDAAMVQQDYVNAQTLATQIAEISSATGEDFQQVLEDMGIDSMELAQRLHLDSEAALQAYMDNQQSMVDSAGENTASIVDALDRLGDRLLGETRRDDSARDGAGPVIPDGHSNRGRPGDATNRDIVDAQDRNTDETRRLREQLDRTFAPRGRSIRTGEAA